MKNRKGFTLIELLVAIIIFAVVGTLFTSIFLSIVNTRTESVQDKRTKQDIQLIERYITSRFRFYDDNTSTFTVNDTNDDSVVDLVFSVGTNQYVFSFDNTDLSLIWVDVASPENNGQYDCSGSIEDVTFQIIGTSILKCEISYISTRDRPLTYSFLLSPRTSTTVATP